MTDHDSVEGRGANKVDEKTTRAKTVREVDRLNAELEAVMQVNDRLKKRVEQMEKCRENENRNAINTDELTRALSEMAERLKAIESRERRIPVVESESRMENKISGCENPREEIVSSGHKLISVGEGTVVQAKLPKGGWLKNPFEDLRFFGRNDSQNPFRFVKKFERIANYEEVGESEQLYYFGKCMRGTAANWYDVHEPDTIARAKTEFLEHYWGEAQQARFREDLYTGVYKGENNATMAEYALNLTKQAKMLVPPMIDSEIIRCVKRHFESEIAREIRPSTVKSIDELINLLDDIEYESKREKRVKNISKTISEKPVSNNGKFRNKINKLNPRNTDDATADARGAAYTQRRASDERRGRQTSVSGYKGRPTITTADANNAMGISKVPTDANSGKELVVYNKQTAERAITNNKRSGKVISDKKQIKPRNIAVIKHDNNSRSEQSSDSDESNNEPNDTREIAILRTKEIIQDIDEISNRDQNLKLNKSLPYVVVSINEITVKTLIDTGAQISAITKDLYDKIAKAGIGIKVIPIRKFFLTGAFGDKGQAIANRVQIGFTIGKNRFSFEFYIVKNLSYQMILGMDFLREHVASLLCGPENFAINFEKLDKEVEINAINVEEAELILNNTLNKYGKLFENNIGRVNHYEHEIKMNNDKAFKTKMYPIPDIHKDRVKKLIQNLENDGIIEKAATQYINPLVVVTKRSGDIRLCLDARELNKRMANDHDQPPTIDEIFRRIGSKKFFTTLDVASAFWQIPLTEKSKKYTGFMFDNQSYVFNRLPFGLKTAGASFTRAMQSALGNECDEFIIVYLDDILIASNSLEEHLYHLDVVFRKLQNAGFRLNRAKCEIMRTEIRFLGHTFDQITAEMSNDTRLAIQNFEKPKNKKAIQAFLGLINWDRRFVKNLSRYTKPLENLLKKNIKFQWTDELQKTFTDIKQKFNEAPKLYVIKPELMFGIQVDASKYGLGARLYQYDERDPEKKFTVAYASRSLKGAELNYTITEVECLAIVWALRKWHTALLGRKVKVHTDHRALKFISSCARDSARIARWIAFLNEFDLEIEHIPGKENQIADTLSRRNIKNGYARKNERTKIIAAIRKPDDECDTAEWVELIANAQQNETEQHETQENNIEIRDGLKRVKTAIGERVIVPEGIKWQLVDKIHEYILHFGTDKTIDFAKQYFQIANLERIARDVVASCEVCQTTKYYTRPTRGVEYYDLPEEPNRTVSMDLFGPLPQTARGNKYILVVMDQFSKYTKLYPIKNQKLDTIMDCLQIRYFHDVGVPSEILTDNGGQFIAERWRRFAEDIGFKVRKTSPYNPQSNPVERVMREIGRIIRVYAHDRQTRWDKIIDRAEITINATTHRSTGIRPIDLHENVEERMRIDDRLVPKTTLIRNGESIGESAEVINREDRVGKAATTLKRRAEQRKIQRDKHEEAKPYQAGDKIWVKIHKRSDARRRLTKKIHLVFEGPYVIREDIRKNAYLIVDEDGQAIGTYNSRQLRPYREAKLKPQIEINAIERASDTKINARRERKHPEKIVQINMMHGAENKKSVSISHINKHIEKMHKEIKENIITDRQTKSREPKIERTSPEEKKSNLKKKNKKEYNISEKGMRHVSRILKIINGKSVNKFIHGVVEKIPMKIIFDTRGEFNVISKKAVKLIEESGKKLIKIKQSTNIPAYLRRERKIQLKATIIKAEIFGQEIDVEAMILEGAEPCLMIARITRRELGRKINFSTPEESLLRRSKKSRNQVEIKKIPEKMKKSHPVETIVIKDDSPIIDVENDESEIIKNNTSTNHENVRIIEVNSGKVQNSVDKNFDSKLKLNDKLNFANLIESTTPKNSDSLDRNINREINVQNTDEENNTDLSNVNKADAKKFDNDVKYSCKNCLDNNNICDICLDNKFYKQDVNKEKPLNLSGIDISLNKEKSRKNVIEYDAKKIEANINKMSLNLEKASDRILTKWAQTKIQSKDYPNNENHKSYCTTDDTNVTKSNKVKFYFFESLKLRKNKTVSWNELNNSINTSDNSSGKINASENNFVHESIENENLIKFKNFDISQFKINRKICDKELDVKINNCERIELNRNVTRTVNNVTNAGHHPSQTRGEGIATPNLTSARFDEENSLSVGVQKNARRQILRDIEIIREIYKMENLDQIEKEAFEKAIASIRYASMIRSQKQRIDALKKWARMYTGDNFDMTTEEIEEKYIAEKSKVLSMETRLVKEMATMENSYTFHQQMSVMNEEEEEKYIIRQMTTIEPVAGTNLDNRPFRIDSTFDNGKLTSKIYFVILDRTSNADKDEASATKNPVVQELREEITENQNSEETRVTKPRVISDKIIKQPEYRKILKRKTNKRRLTDTSSDEEADNDTPDVIKKVTRRNLRSRRTTLGGHMKPEDQPSTSGIRSAEVSSPTPKYRASEREVTTDDEGRRLTRVKLTLVDEREAECELPSPQLET